MAVEKVILAKPRGFCAGVEMAVETVERALQRHGPPIYVFHEIVHNQHVVGDFTRRGVRFVQSLDEVPAGAKLIFSAHGVSPAVWQQAKEKRLELVIDATCPLVEKVHREVRSEEHTSELQSQSNLVCRLLLEKKKRTPYTVI